MLKFINTLVKVIPFIVAAVKAVEVMAQEGSWTSEAKQNAAVELVTELSAAVGLTISGEVVDIVRKTIDVVVRILNAVVWKK